MNTMPGPASSVEERSLRNISSKGTAVRISPRIFLFSREFIRKRIDGNLQQSDVLHQLTQPWSRKAVENVSTEVKRNVSLEIGPMTSSLDRVTSYTLLRNSTNTTLPTCYNNSSQILTYSRTRALIGWPRPNSEVPSNFGARQII